MNPIPSCSAISMILDQCAHVQSKHCDAVPDRQGVDWVQLNKGTDTSNMQTGLSLRKPLIRQEGVTWIVSACVRASECVCTYARERPFMCVCAPFRIPQTQAGHLYIICVQAMPHPEFPKLRPTACSKGAKTCDHHSSGNQPLQLRKSPLHLMMRSTASWRCWNLLDT